MCSALTNLKRPLKLELLSDKSISAQGCDDVETSPIVLQINGLVFM